MRKRSQFATFGIENVIFCKVALSSSPIDGISLEIVGDYCEIVATYLEILATYSKIVGTYWETVTIQHTTGSRNFPDAWLRYDKRE